MDRFLIGLSSGMGAGVVMDLWGFLAKNVLHISTRSYIDWTAGVIYGSLPVYWYECLFALLTHLVWCGFLGITLSYILQRSSSRHFLLKGTLFGFLVGFFVFSIAILLRLPGFSKIPFATSLSNAIGGITWGLLAAKLQDWFYPQHTPKNKMTH